MIRTAVAFHPPCSLVSLPSTASGSLATVAAIQAVSSSPCPVVVVYSPSVKKLAMADFPMPSMEIVSQTTGIPDEM